MIEARTRSRVPAGCSGCGVLSDWTHSRYVRHLADAALGGRPVRIDLSVRRLYCENPSCPKVTFAEQVPRLTVRYQRRTPLLQHLVESVGVVLAGRGGARMLRVMNVGLSRCTVLAQLMRMPLPPLVTPRVLGWGRLRVLRRHLRHPPGRCHHPPPAHTLGRTRCRTAQPMAPRASRSRDRLP
ncbi:transposase family protein [Streptomyces sp. NPDC051109]|uniref:transposase family protein n=1 Tax=Streptomyces sp. NPDC051109 TaxID=3365642 RepID=UPI0037A3945E